MSKRSLGQWLHWLEQLHPVEIDMGLQRVQEVARLLGLARPAKQIVTVTGTNGKGSTCALLEALCRQQGLRTAVYSSPHFLRYNERIRVNGEEASDEAISAAFEAIEKVRDDISLTYFEMGTLAALQIFSQAELDVAILEVGLGGRLDAVNIVDPDVAVVTGIALDHADWLGDSRESVGREKAGIFRSGKPVVCGDIDPPQSLLSQAVELGCPLYVSGREFSAQQQTDSWSWRGVDEQGKAIELSGLQIPGLPMGNAAIALQAFALLNRPLAAQAAGPALADARLTGRLQQIKVGDGQSMRTLILDVAHNPQAAAHVADWLRQRPLQGRRYAVFGALGDKDVAGVLAVMHGQFAGWHIAPLPSSRSLASDQLQELLLQADEPCTAYADMGAALEGCVTQSTPADEILVFGSFFTVAAVLEYLGRTA